MTGNEVHPARVVLRADEGSRRDLWRVTDEVPRPYCASRATEASSVGS